MITIKELEKPLKHLQKAKKVSVKVWYAKNGHWIGVWDFGCALEAKRFCEKVCAEAKKELFFSISDTYNQLYYGPAKAKF